MNQGDGAVRIDAQYAQYVEPHFRYLNRSARPEISRIRGVLDRWFARYPEAGQSGLRSAFRSDDDWQHEGAFFELFLHELVARFGCEVELHPSIQGTTKRPDFLVTPRRGEPFYLEATVATGESAEERAQRARANTVYDGLNKLDSPNFFLSVSAEKTPSIQPSARKMREAVARWLRRLDPDDIIAERQAGAVGRNLPTFDYSDAGWSVHFRAIPKSPAARAKIGVRPIGILMPPEGEWIDVRTKIRDAVMAKVRRYRTLDRSSVVAVNARSRWSVGQDDVIEALFGQEKFTVNMDNPTAAPIPGRVLDGLWTSATGPRYTRNSAVLVAHSLSPWSLATSEVRMYHNPWAKRPYASCLNRLPRAVAIDGHLSLIKGVDLHKLFAVHPRWPMECGSRINER